MPKRMPLSRQLRFHILTRDRFTCQYCGRSAPEVRLEVDHVVPVAAGGSNEYGNLITACFDCNNGKRADELPHDLRREKSPKIKPAEGPDPESAKQLQQAAMAIDGFVDPSDLAYAVSAMLVAMGRKMSGKRLPVVAECTSKYGTYATVEAYRRCAQRGIKFSRAMSVAMTLRREQLNPDLKDARDYIRGLCKGKYDNDKWHKALLDHVMRTSDHRRDGKDLLFKIAGQSRSVYQMYAAYRDATARQHC